MTSLISLSLVTGRTPTFEIRRLNPLASVDDIPAPDCKSLNEPLTEMVPEIIFEDSVENVEVDADDSPSATIVTGSVHLYAYGVRIQSVLMHRCQKIIKGL